MCGRLNITDSPLVSFMLDYLGLPPLPGGPRWNIAPSEAVPVVHHLDGQLQCSPMRWWLVPSWSDGPSQKYAMFNARIETVATSRAFKGPMRYRRGILPAASFVEWQRTEQGKQPWLFEGSEEPLALAAVWDLWQEELLSCAILTQPAHPKFSAIHHRMPVMLPQDCWWAWLDSDTTVEQALAMADGAAVSLQATPVDASYNNARNKAEPRAVDDPSPLPLND